MQMHSSEVLSATLRFIIFNRRDAEKNQENNFCGSNTDAFLRSSLCDFAVKYKTAEKISKTKKPRVGEAFHVFVHPPGIEPGTH